MTNKTKSKNSRIKKPSNTELVNFNEIDDQKWCFKKEEYSPMSFLGIKALAADLRKWIDEYPKATKLGQFLDLKEIIDDDYYRWLKKYPILQISHDFALRRLGNRREQGVVDKVYNGNDIMPYMAMYDKRHKEFIEWKSSLKQKENNAESVQKIVVVEKYPDSPKVPTKKKNDESA